MQAEDHDVVLIDDARLFRGYHRCSGDYGTECYPTIEVFLFFVFLRFYLLRKCNWDYGTECYPTIEVFFIFYFMFLLTSQVQW